MEAARQQTETASAKRPAPEAVQCPNCGAPVWGPYCHRCGQKHRSRIVSLRDLAADAASNFLTLDNRVARTLRPLLLKPGFLTNEYVAGRRAPYMSPFRLYLLVSLLYFLVLGISAESSIFLGGLIKTGLSTGAEFRIWLPRLMFIIMPGFALLLKLFYRKRHRLYVEHLVFSIHFHGFFFLILTLIALLRRLGEITPWAAFGGAMLALLLRLAIPLYLYLALRRVYRQRRGIAALKTVALLFCYGLLLVLACVPLLLLLER